ncbi:MAG: hypothetical protein QM661_10470 [Solimonas sp.]
MSETFVLGIRPWKLWQIERLLGARHAPRRYVGSAAAILRERELRGAGLGDARTRGLRGRAGGARACCA